jgi:SAM-dependent methyltransferase
MIPRQSNLLRSMINEHVRRAVAGGRLRGLILNISAGSVDYRELIETQPGTQMIATDWLRAPTKVAVNVFCDAGALPFAPRSFDAVLCTEVLEHLPTPARTLSEARRVLKDGGWLLLTTPFQYHAHQRPYDYFRYTAQGLTSLLGDAGFDEIEIRRSGDSLAVLLYALRRQHWRGTTRLLNWAESFYLRRYGERAISADVWTDAMALGYCAHARAPRTP